MAELLRYDGPNQFVRRIAMRDMTFATSAGPVTIPARAVVYLSPGSANRDEAVFEDPYRFDIGRTPNDHLGFGGPGPHFCLGAHLARREITVMFKELFQRMPDIRAVGEPDRLQSNVINGIKHLQAEWTPASAG